MLMKHISERPTPLSELRPDLPANLVYAIERAMAKGRDDRWPDAGAFRDALAEDAVPGPAVRDARPAGDTRPAAPQRDDEVFIGAIGRFPPFPAVRAGIGIRRKRGEPGYGQTELDAWREQARLWRQQVREQKADFLIQSRDERREARHLRRLDKKGVDRTPEDRIRRVQATAFRTVGMVAFLGAINAVTSPQFPWVIFPMFAMGLELFGRITGLWTDGIPLRRLFQRQPRPVPQSAGDSRAERGALLPAPTGSPAPSAANADFAGIPREVLDGVHGAAIREAADSKAVISDVLAKLSAADRELLPEIQPTVDLLVDRVRSLAQALHQLDRDASAEAIARLEQRIAESRAMPEDAPERERRLQLLERQLATLTDLAARRTTVSQQLESASLVLETMKLDLLKLRSSGLESKLDASTGATQEARALSTDIGRIIEAANEVRRL
jgi:serine/threonine-protein kinase